MTEGRFALTLPLRRLERQIEITVEEKAPGSALGWSALVAPHRWNYSARCMQEGAVIAFPRAALEKVLQSDVDLGYRFMRNLSQLIGSRIVALQNLWIEEVEHTITRVDYWTRATPSSVLN